MVTRCCVWLAGNLSRGVFVTPMFQRNRTHLFTHSARAQLIQLVMPISVKVVLVSGA